MLSDPFSKKLRRCIPVEDYEQLVIEQRTKGFIGMSPIGFGRESVEGRIDQLETLERERGFVYVGEKLWLEEFLRSEEESAPALYSDWVRKAFKDGLGVEFVRDQRRVSPLTFSSTRARGFPLEVWKIRLERGPAEFLPCFPELANPYFEDLDVIEELDVSIPGTEEEPSRAHMIAAFEFLHDLEYVLAKMPRDTGGYSEVSFDGLTIVSPDDPMCWTIVVTSEYGSEFDLAVMHRHRWRG